MSGRPVFSLMVVVVVVVMVVVILPMFAEADSNREGMIVKKRVVDDVRMKRAVEDMKRSLGAGEAARLQRMVAQVGKVGRGRRAAGADRVEGDGGGLVKRVRRDMARGRLLKRAKKMVENKIQVKRAVEYLKRFKRASEDNEFKRADKNFEKFKRAVDNFKKAKRAAKDKKEFKRAAEDKNEFKRAAEDKNEFKRAAEDKNEFKRAVEDEKTMRLKRVAKATRMKRAADRLQRVFDAEERFNKIVKQKRSVDGSSQNFGGGLLAFKRYI